MQSFYGAWQEKKILICKPQCWINAAFYPANFHILPQAHTSWHTVHGTKFNMFVTLFKVLHEKFMSIDLVWELLPVSLYRVNIFQAAVFYAFMFSNPLYIMEISSVRWACVIVPIVNCLCVCVHISNGTVVTRHISKLQSSLLSLYASQASVCSRSNSTFVTLKLTLRGWDFYSSNQQSTSQTEQFTDSLEMLCWDSTMVWILPLS